MPARHGGRFAAMPARHGEQVLFLDASPSVDEVPEGVAGDHAFHLAALEEVACRIPNFDIENRRRCLR